MSGVDAGGLAAGGAGGSSRGGFETLAVGAGVGFGLAGFAPGSRASPP